ncbi:hypothetical protein KUD11_03505 [Roseovarius sp. LXJ103]|uniref:hypothetical protein n=1 Tax=Roseovarius carneus TaxID=2853164 RepID=UPI0011B1CAC7|nr:hypothetical protein [Roseovarius carneus]MBZ8117710.1 hypothetical protein [Roseovarius carneus]
MSIFPKKKAKVGTPLPDWATDPHAGKQDAPSPQTVIGSPACTVQQENHIKVNKKLRFFLEEILKRALCRAVQSAIDTSRQSKPASGQ